MLSPLIIFVLLAMQWGVASRTVFYRGRETFMNSIQLWNLSMFYLETSFVYYINQECRSIFVSISVINDLRRKLWRKTRRSGQMATFSGISFTGQYLILFFDYSVKTSVKIVDYYKGYYSLKYKKTINTMYRYLFT